MDPETRTQTHRYKEHMNDKADKHKSNRHRKMYMTERYRCTQTDTGHEHKGTVLKNHPPISYIISFVTYVACIQVYEMCKHMLSSVAVICPNYKQ